MIEVFGILLGQFREVMTGDAPWWIYFIIIFVPFSVLLAIREGYCWFNKVNRVVSRLEKIDRRLEKLNSAIDNLSKVIGNSHITTHEPEDSKKSQTSESHFTLEKEWSGR